ncbi:MAG: hypothetical protein ABSH19_01930 [Opitutales bacterium]|jgi:hypothetical protein
MEDLKIEKRMTELENTHMGLAFVMGFIQLDRLGDEARRKIAVCGIIRAQWTRPHFDAVPFPGMRALTATIGLVAKGLFSSVSLPATSLSGLDWAFSIRQYGAETPAGHPAFFLRF